jgi:hypothetical protein
MPLATPTSTPYVQPAVAAARQCAAGFADQVRKVERAARVILGGDGCADQDQHAAPA